MSLKKFTFTAAVLLVGFAACKKDVATADVGDAAALDASVAVQAAPTTSASAAASVATPRSGAHVARTDAGAAHADAGATKTDGGAAAGGKGAGFIGGTCIDGWRCLGAANCKDGACTCDDAANPQIRRCDGLCTPAFDASNCGGCGVKCKESEECMPSNGKTMCIACATLGADYKDCRPYQCANLTKDTGNCGACGKRCNPGEFCVQGSCKKP